MWNNLDDALTCLLTEMKAYADYNVEAEKACVKMGFRGLGRFHERMGLRASMDYLNSGKMLADHPVGLIIMPNYDRIVAVSKSAYFKPADLLAHIQAWHKHLLEMHAKITDVAYFANEHKKITMYKHICKYIEQLENEVWAVGVLADRIIPSNHQHADVKAVMKDLHKYFEKTYDGCMIDFDI